MNWKSYIKLFFYLSVLFTLIKKTFFCLECKNNYYHINAWSKNRLKIALLNVDSSDVITKNLHYKSQYVDYNFLFHNHNAAFCL